MVRYGIDNPRLDHDPESIQRVVEGQNLETRRFLHRYETFLEDLRKSIQFRRQLLLKGTTPCGSELERLVSLTTIDDLWSEYLGELADLRAGLHWFELGGGDPYIEFVNRVHALFNELEFRIDEEIPKRLASAKTSGIDPSRRGATWTYLTTDSPFGSWTARVARGIVRMIRGRV